MDRREFIGHSGVVLGAVLIGLPSLADADSIENSLPEKEYRPRLLGHKRFGCSRTLNDPSIALQLPADFTINIV